MDIMNCFRQLIKPNQTVVDVGAHSGQFSLFFSEIVGSQGKVLAVEANPWTYCVLSSTVIRQRDNIMPVCRAASDKVGRMEILVPDTEGSERSTISTAFSDAFGWNIKSRYMIEVDTLDNICGIHDIKPDFIKIDTEGVEHLVIAGATNTIRSYRPKIAFEFHYNPKWIADIKSSEQMSHIYALRQMGYEVLLVGIESWYSYTRDGIRADNKGYPGDSYISFEEDLFVGMKSWLGNGIALHREAHRDILDAIKIMPFAEMRDTVMYKF